MNDQDLQFPAIAIKVLDFKGAIGKVSLPLCFDLKAITYHLAQHNMLSQHAYLRKKQIPIFSRVNKSTDMCDACTDSGEFAMVPLWMTGPADTQQSLSLSIQGWDASYGGANTRHHPGQTARCLR